MQRKIPTFNNRWQCIRNAALNSSSVVRAPMTSQSLANHRKTRLPFQEVGANVLQHSTAIIEQAKIWVKVIQNHVFYSFNVQAQVRGGSRSVVTIFITSPTQRWCLYSASSVLSNVVNQLEVCYVDTSNYVNVIPLWQGLCVFGLNSVWDNYQWLWDLLHLWFALPPRLTALCRLQRIQSHMVSKSSHVLVSSKRLTSSNDYFVRIIYCVSFYVFFWSL